LVELLELQLLHTPYTLEGRDPLTGTLNVVTAMTDLAALGTPSPLPVPSVVEDLSENFRSWRKLFQDGDLTVGFDPWVFVDGPYAVCGAAGWISALPALGCR
jgi:hypothetical protein